MTNTERNVRKPQNETRIFIHFYFAIAQDRSNVFAQKL